jgi:hypothetical protein
VLVLQPGLYLVFRIAGLKFTASGKLIMAIGKKMIPGSGPRELCKPTQVRGAHEMSAHALGVAWGLVEQ